MKRHLRRFSRLLKRGLLLRCPACGQGRIFESVFFRRAECAVCRTAFEPEPGYFTGGMELHWIVIYVVGIAGYFAAEPVLPAGREASLITYLGCLLAASVLLYRHTRSLWMALDWFWDPEGREELESPRGIATPAPTPARPPVRTGP